jgi:hypothetical protein
LLWLSLAGLMALERRVTVRPNGPLLVFGHTALFFYLIHFIVLGAGALALGLMQRGGLVETYVATLATLAILYPLCRWYRTQKWKRPHSLMRYV